MKKKRRERYFMPPGLILWSIKRHQFPLHSMEVEYHWYVKGGTECGTSPVKALTPINFIPAKIIYCNLNSYSQLEIMTFLALYLFIHKCHYTDYQLQLLHTFHTCHKTQKAQERKSYATCTYAVLLHHDSYTLPLASSYLTILILPQQIQRCQPSSTLFSKYPITIRRSDVMLTSFCTVLGNHIHISFGIGW